MRVWVPGCATGEEAYSVAMLLCEQAERLDSPPTIQIFATDIDDEAVQDGRAGVYPMTIEADVSQERLRRFFLRDQGRYRIKKEIRELVLFAPHDVLKDPAFFPSRSHLLPEPAHLLETRGAAIRARYFPFRAALRRIALYRRLGKRGGGANTFLAD